MLYYTVLGHVSSADWELFYERQLRKYEHKALWKEKEKKRVERVYIPCVYAFIPRYI